MNNRRAAAVIAIAAPCGLAVVVAATAGPNAIHHGISVLAGTVAVGVGPSLAAVIARHPAVGAASRTGVRRGFRGRLAADADRCRPSSAAAAVPSLPIRKGA